MEKHFLSFRLLVSVFRRVFSDFIVPYRFVFFNYHIVFCIVFAFSRVYTEGLPAVVFCPTAAGVPPCIPVCQSFIKMSVFPLPALFFTVCIPAGLREIT